MQGDRLEAQGRTDAGTVNSFMAARCPAGALLYAQGVVGISDQQLTTTHSLEVALVTEIGVASSEQLRVDRAVGGVAHGAAFTDCLVFKDMRASLCRMAA